MSTLSFSQTGGFSSYIDQIYIDINLDKKSISVRTAWDGTPRTSTLEAADLAWINTAIQKTILPAAGSVYRCKQCADQFIYDLTLTRGTASYKLHWEDGSNAPAALNDLREKMVRLASKY